MYIRCIYLGALDDIQDDGRPPYLTTMNNKGYIHLLSQVANNLLIGLNFLGFARHSFDRCIVVRLCLPIGGVDDMEFICG
jgi:hypothetical protein